MPRCHLEPRTEGRSQRPRNWLDPSPRERASWSMITLVPPGSALPHSCKILARMLTYLSDAGINSLSGAICSRLGYTKKQGTNWASTLIVELNAYLPRPRREIPISLCVGRCPGFPSILPLAFDPADESKYGIDPCPSVVEFSIFFWGPRRAG